MPVHHLCFQRAASSNYDVVPVFPYILILIFLVLPLEKVS
ncbi:unnamed protein product, partial [marine sediment metagenome]